MPITPVHDGLFEETADGPRLVGGYSPTSGKYHFPLLSTCPYSGATDVQRVHLSAVGTLWGWTAVTAAPPGYLGEVPFGFGVVELPENDLRVITRLTVSDPGALEFGQPMQLVVDPLHVDDDGNEVVTWAFAPGEVAR
jgi:uncharacterized OB-fold protein